MDHLASAIRNPEAGGVLRPAFGFDFSFGFGFGFGWGFGLAGPELRGPV